MVNKVKSEQLARSMSSDEGTPGKTAPHLVSWNGALEITTLASWNDASGGDARRAMEPSMPLQHKGDEPFRAPHILLIPLAQLRLEDVLFYMDTVTHAKQRTSHNDEQTQPVRQAESQSE